MVRRRAIVDQRLGDPLVLIMEISGENSERLHKRLLGTPLAGPDHRCCNANVDFSYYENDGMKPIGETTAWLPTKSSEIGIGETSRRETARRNTHDRKYLRRRSLM